MTFSCVRISHPLLHRNRVLVVLLPRLLPHLIDHPVVSIELLIPPLLRHHHLMNLPDRPIARPPDLDTARPDGGRLAGWLSSSTSIRWKSFARSPLSRSCRERRGV